MFFLLSKLLYFLTTPIVWVLILLLASLFSKFHKKLLISLTLIVLLLFSNKALYNQAMKAFIHKQSPEVINNRYSAGIVLGGMCNYNEKVNTIVFNETGDRLAQTLRLYNLNIIDKIIVSGGAGRLFTEEKKEADIIKQYLLSLNIPEEDILIEKTSKNTYENAKYTAKLIRRAELKGNFLLISSAQHLPRAQKCFSKQGIETEIYSANMDIGTPLGVSDYFIPQAKTLKDWEKLIHEIIGIWAYRLFGYI